MIWMVVLLMFLDKIYTPENMGLEDDLNHLPGVLILIILQGVLL